MDLIDLQQIFREMAGVVSSPSLGNIQIKVQDTDKVLK